MFYCTSRICAADKLVKGELSGGRDGSSGLAHSVQVNLAIGIVHCVEVLAEEEAAFDALTSSHLDSSWTVGRRYAESERNFITLHLSIGLFYLICLMIGPSPAAPSVTLYKPGRISLEER